MARIFADMSDEPYLSRFRRIERTTDLKILTYEHLAKAMKLYGPIKANWVDYLIFAAWAGIARLGGITSRASLIPLLPLMPLIALGPQLFFRDLLGFTDFPKSVLLAIFILPAVLYLVYLGRHEREIRIKALYIEHGIPQAHKICLRIYYCLVIALDLVIIAVAV